MVHAISGLKTEVEKREEEREEEREEKDVVNLQPTYAQK
jgi:hypothetical protein